MDFVHSVVYSNCTAAASVATSDIITASVASTNGIAATTASVAAAFQADKHNI